MIRGLDVSEANGLIDWDRVPAEFRYVFVKCSEGEAYLDPLRQRNLEGAARSGRYAFVYGFFRSSMDPEKQAEAIWNASGPSMPLLVMLDFETKADNLTPREACAKAAACVRGIVARFGRHPTLYLYPWFERGELAGVIHEFPDLVACALTMADYSGGERPPEGWNPYVPRGWSTWTFAQTSGNNSSIVPGIPGHVDHDVFNGDEAALRDFLGLPPPRSTQPEPVVHPSVDFPPREPTSED